jgi:hypothetical protein
MSALMSELFFTCLPVIVTAATALPRSTMNRHIDRCARNHIRDIPDHDPDICADSGVA